jgi:hypothetical protein
LRQLLPGRETVPGFLFDAAGAIRMAMSVCIDVYCYLRPSRRTTADFAREIPPAIVNALFFQ